MPTITPPATQTHYRIVVLIGGSGTNLQAMINALQQPRFAPAVLTGVISHNPDVLGLKRAEKAHIPCHVINHRHYAERADFEAALIQRITPWHPALIVLAGFMRKLTPTFIQHYPNKIINVHPALLPKYKGMHTHERAIAAGDTQHGASIHVVTDMLDAGPLLAQSHCRITTQDTPETLKNKVQKIEWQLLPEVIRWLAQGTLHFSPQQQQWQYKGARLPKQGKQLSFKSF